MKLRRILKNQMCEDTHQNKIVIPIRLLKSVKKFKVFKYQLNTDTPPNEIIVSDKNKTLSFVIISPVYNNETIKCYRYKLANIPPAGLENYFDWQIYAYAKNN